MGEPCDLGLARVKERVAKGGHDVAEAVVRWRFGRSVRNFFVEYRRLADSWYLFDNSGAILALIALQRAAATLRIMNRNQYRALIARHADE